LTLVRFVNADTSLESPLNSSRERAIHAARAADDKSATDILVLHVGDVLGITECFVIASAQTTRQSKAVADEVQERMIAVDDSRPLRIEGMQDREWILLDYGDIVVHVFISETREYYELERLWRDVDSISWQTDASIL